MADYDINAVTRRVQYSGSAGTGPYAFSFEVLNQTDIAVYKNATKLTLTADYTVSVGAAGTGSVTLVVAATGSDTVTLVGARDIERTTDFVTGGAITASAFNDQLDALTIFDQQLAEADKRTLSAPVYDPNHTDDGGTLDMTLPAKATRAGKVLGFDDTTGNPIATVGLSDVTTLSEISADIATLADIEDGTDATDAIQTVAGISSNVTTVAGISGNVTTVAGISSNVTSVAGNTSNINTVAGIDADVTTVAGISSDVTTVAGDTSDIQTLADIEDGTVATNAISTLGPISSDITTVAGISSDVTTVADNDANVTTVAGVSANVTTVAGISANVTTVAGISADVTTVAGISSDVTTVATNVAGVNSFAERYRVAASDPTTSLDEGDLVYNTTSNALKFYDGSSWNSVNVTGIGTVADDTTPQLGGNLDLNSFDITGTGNLNFTGNVTLTGTVDGRDVATDGTKLDGIESGATADQTGAEIASAISGETVAALTVTDLNTTSINGGQVSGRRNMLYNGDFRIAQRSTTGTVTAGAYNDIPAHDRWKYQHTSGTTSVFSVSQTSDAPVGTAHSLILTTTTADASLSAGDAFYITQLIEGADVQHLDYGSSDAKSVTLSFWCKSSLTGDLSVGLFGQTLGYNITSTITINSANTWEYKTVTFAGDQTNAITNSTAQGWGVYINLAAGSNYTSTDSTSWGAYSAGRLAYGQTFNLQGTLNATFQLAKVQVEVGSVATEFEYRSYGEELALCRRYYRTINLRSSQGGRGGFPGSGNSVSVLFHHSQPYRAVPTVTTNSIAPAYYNGAWVTAGTSLSAACFEDYFYAGVYNAAIGVNNDYLFRWANGATMYMYLDAEL